jgi:hypothetical protein
MDINQVISHMRNREYMSGVERDKSRVKQTGECFTPTALVQEMLDKLPLETFKENKTFLDPTCGDGQFLSEVVIRKVENGIPYSYALTQVYGADLMLDNCIETIKRLYGVQREPMINILRNEEIPKAWRRPGLKALFEVNGDICNVVQADGLLYDYSFGEAMVASPKDPQTDTGVPLFEFD